MKNTRYYTGALGSVEIEDLKEIMREIIEEAGDDGIEISNLIASLACTADFNETEIRRLIRRKFNVRMERSMISPYNVEIIVRLKV